MITSFLRNVFFFFVFLKKGIMFVLNQEYISFLSALLPLRNLFLGFPNELPIVKTQGSMKNAPCIAPCSRSCKDWFANPFSRGPYHLQYSGPKNLFFLSHHMVSGVNWRQDFVPFSLGFYVLNPTNYEMKHLAVFFLFYLTSRRLFFTSLSRVLVITLLYKIKETVSPRLEQNC